MDAAGIDRAVIGGVSMGGYIALALLRRTRTGSGGLVLVDTRSGADDDAALERRRVAADRADRGEIAAGPDAIAPLIADETADDTRSTLAGIAGAVPAGLHRLGPASDGRPAGFHRSARRDRGAGAGGGGGEGRA